jgi:5-methyltetrahydrofolate--homocysteine methyltransferase
MADLSALTDSIERGDRTAAVAATQAALDAGTGPVVILDAMTDAMASVGRRFQLNEIYIPEMLVAARAMKESVALLEPLLVESGAKPDAVAVIGTVRGDLHDIGKNLVGMMWKGAKIEVIDLGANVEPERFVAAIQEHHARLVGVSALLTTTMVGMKDVVDAIRAAGLNETKVIVGGAPVTAEFASLIGANGYAPDAGSAVDVAKGLLRT